MVSILRDVSTHDVSPLKVNAKCHRVYLEDDPPPTMIPSVDSIVATRRLTREEFRQIDFYSMLRIYLSIRVE